MKATRYNYTISDAYCEECGVRTTIPRRKNSARKQGHLKTLYCWNCKKDTRFIEVKPNDFLLSVAINKACI